MHHDALCDRRTDNTVYDIFRNAAKAELQKYRQQLEISSFLGWGDKPIIVTMSPKKNCPRLKITDEMSYYFLEHTDMSSVNAEQKREVEQLAHRTQATSNTIIVTVNAPSFPVFSFHFLHRRLIRETQL